MGLRKERSAGLSHIPPAPTPPASDKNIDEPSDKGKKRVRDLEQRLDSAEEQVANTDTQLKNLPEQQQMMAGNEHIIQQLLLALGGH